MRRLILKGIDRSQIIGAMVGCLLGFTILVTASQLYFDMRGVVGSKSEIWDPGYYVLNKEVSMVGDLLGGGGFDSSEIREIREKPFVEDLASFHTSDFRIQASMDQLSRSSGLKSQLFFEAVPDRFLDVSSGVWHWNEDSEFLPIVVPSHYIALYNFGFARSQGLPRISKSMVGQVSFRVRIQGNGRSKSYKGRIVAFSDRINSILVPMDFMKWANDRFGEGKEKAPSRLIVVSEDPSASSLFSFAEGRDYELQGADERTGKLSSLLNIGMGIVGATAAIIIALAAWLLIISFRLLIVKNRATIEKLHLLGYDLLGIGRVYIRLMGIFSAAILLGSLGFAFLLRTIYAPLFENAGFEMGGWSFWTFLVALFVMLLINGVNKLLLDRQLLHSLHR